jgi:hypothetical protein
MKTAKIFMLLLFFTSFAIQAQSSKKEKVKALKVAFITSELPLTSSEAEKFWPIYNAFEDKQFEIRYKKMHLIKDKLDSAIDKLSDKEALILVAQIEAAEDDLYQNRKKMIQNLKSVIGPVKILKLKKAEDDFNKKLLKQYRNKGPEKP